MVAGVRLGTRRGQGSTEVDAAIAAAIAADVSGPGWAAGEYHGNDTENGISSFQAGALTQNRIYAMWCPVGEPTPIDRIGAEITTISAGKSFRVAAFRRGPVRGIPGALLVESAALSAGTLGFVEDTVSVVLPTPGVWLAINAEDATMQFRLLGSTGRIAVQGKPSGGGTSGYGSRVVVATFGAMPATYPAGSTPTANGPIVNVRAA